MARFFEDRMAAVLAEIAQESASYVDEPQTQTPQVEIQSEESFESPVEYREYLNETWAATLGGKVPKHVTNDELINQMLTSGVGRR